MKKKALFLIENMSYTYDRRMRAMARTLQRDGWQISVICPRAKGEKFFEADEGAFVYRYPSFEFRNSQLNYLVEYPLSLIFTFLLSIYILLRRGFKIIHACNPPDVFFLIGWFYWPFGKRFIYDQHDLCPELYRSRFEKPKKFIYKVLLFFERLQVQLAASILVVNELCKEKMLTRHPKAGSKMFVVRNAPDNSVLEFVQKRKERREPDDCLNVGYAGVMNPQDGVDLFLRAAAYLVHKTRRLDLRFTLVGDGMSRPDLERLSIGLGLENYVDFSGYRSGDDYLRAILDFDIAVQPDPLTEMNDVSTMRKSIEYMALGRPIVAFGLKETINTCGEAALYARSNEFEHLAGLILKLVDDGELRDKVGRAARLRAIEKLDWKQQEPILQEAYQNALTPRKHRKR